MRFSPLPIAGAWLVEPERLTDVRGFFARVWCEQEFADHGIAHRAVQANVGYSPKRGTLRGLHYQAAPDLEAEGLVEPTEQPGLLLGHEGGVE